MIPVDVDPPASTGLRLGRKIALSVILGALVLAGLGIFADLRDVGTSFATFDYRMLVPVLLWTIFNYVLRWLKWDYYLRKLGFGAGVSRYDSALLFTSGMVMAVTPGKIGEVFKSYLLKRINNTPVSASAPIVLAERLTDGLAMLLLMAVGLNLYPAARPVFWILLMIGVLALAALQYRPLAERGFGLLERLPFGSAHRTPGSLVLCVEFRPVFVAIAARFDGSEHRFLVRRMSGLLVCATWLRRTTDEQPIAGGDVCVRGLDLVWPRVVPTGGSWCQRGIQHRLARCC